jgi:hypothetical protein
MYKDARICMWCCSHHYFALHSLTQATFGEYLQVLLRDNRQLFSRALLYGIEYDLIIFDLLILIMWDLIFQVRFGILQEF